MSRPPVRVSLAWTAGEAFVARTGDGRSLVVDGNSRDGLSPVEQLAAATAACMAIDVVHILTKGRRAPDALRVDCTGERAAEEPRRLLAVRLEFAIDGDVDQARVDRAIQLSRDKYCSVWNSLRQDVSLDVTTRLNTTGRG